MKKSENFAGKYYIYPDLTNKRLAEGGYRLQNTEQKYDQPLVSIITAVYNAKDTIEVTIRSVLDQSCQNIEHILIDGGSTDGTLEILEKYSDRLTYYISEPDSGIYSAMNKGISLAQGDYICLLNADDRYSADFVESSLEKTKETGADIVYSQFCIADSTKETIPINDGIYIHHLNINHCTFLVSKEVYNRIGPYREDYKIVSDVVWTRKAYSQTIQFTFLPKCMFFFAEGGTSSGNNEKRKRLIIQEAADSSRETFPFLTDEEAKALYLSRFNIAGIHTLQKLYDRYKNEALFLNAMQKYLTFMLSCNFIFEGEKINKYLPAYRYLAKELSVDSSHFNILYPQHNINAILDHIDSIARALNAKRPTKKLLLHFVSVFSSPSETFIYDLIQRMEGLERYSNIILCDTRLLEEARPYGACIHIDWDNLPSEIRDFLYAYVFEKISPDAIVAHFAINGWKVHQRLEALQIKLPMVHMTHGVDVFAISTNEKYREYILHDASIDPNTAFTTVSRYLFDELVNRGVPSKKITLVPNVVHDRFFKNRKYSGFYDGSRRLELLNVGRLVELKGHSELIDGLNYFVKNVLSNVHLTILYGKADGDLRIIQEKIDRLDLSKYLSLVSFINFNKHPDYYTNFDLFISSSKYSEGENQRSETFGMSTLEAIAAGLPVIVTDAGGSPEVVGKEEIFAKIVPHADGLAIGKAIESFVKDGRCFADNLHYAQDRLSKFNAKRQLQQLDTVLEKVTSKKLKVGVFSSAISGGACKATTRVHKALMINGVESIFMTRNNPANKPKEPNYIFLPPEIGLRWEMLNYKREHVHPGNTIFTINEPNIHRERLGRLVANLDIINVQWVARFLTAEDIGFLSNLNKPLVITVRDMYSLTGGCHFFHGCDRWKEDCDGCPQLVGDKGHIPAKVLAIKKCYWNMKNISFVALSKHTKKIIEQSSLYADNRIKIIANPIELESFSPTPKIEARSHFGIKVNTPLLFYVPSYGSTVKGAHEFKNALKYIKRKYPDFHITLLMAGSATQLVDEEDFLFPVIHLGKFNDDRLLAKAYSAADATIIPSLEETFSNTAAESVSCGTPIIGFQTGAIPEIAGDGLRGESVPVGNIEALGEAIYRVLSKPESAKNCRKYAEDHFSFKEQGRKYAELFHLLNDEASVDAVIDPDQIPIIDPAIAADIYHWQAKVSVMEKKDSIVAAEKRFRLEQKTTEVKLEKMNRQEDINRFKKHFKDLCQVQFIKNPGIKINHYKSLIAMMNEFQLEKIQQIPGSEEFIEAYKDFCAIRFRKEPIKKFKNYKKFLAVWDKYKGEIE